MSILIALDAGHCINTPGRRCLKKFDPQEHREWWLNDRIARYFQKRAEQYEGFRTIRVDDITGAVDVKLAERCRLANEAKADFFLSFHHNGGIEGGSGGGLVAYSYPNSTVGAEWRDALYDAVLAAGKLRGNRASPKATANYAVLRQTNMPAVLIEHGFMDSSTDVSIIITDAYAKACGYAEADCIAKKFGVKLKSEKDEIDLTKEEFNKLFDEKITKAKKDILEDIEKILGKQIAHAEDIPWEGVRNEMRKLLDLEVINGGTDYDKDPSDINLPLSLVRVIVVSAAYTEMCITKLKEEIGSASSKNTLKA